MRPIFSSCLVNFTMVGWERLKSCFAYALSFLETPCLCRRKAPRRWAIRALSSGARARWSLFPLRPIPRVYLSIIFSFRSFPALAPAQQMPCCVQVFTPDFLQILYTVINLPISGGLKTHFQLCYPAVHISRQTQVHFAISNIIRMGENITFYRSTSKLSKKCQRFGFTQWQ